MILQHSNTQFSNTNNNNNNGLGGGATASAGFGLGGNPFQSGGGDTLEFTKRENDILQEFDLFFHRTVTSFNDFFVRPEFANVKVVSKKRYEADLEEETRLKKLNVQIKKNTQANANVTNTSNIGVGGAKKS